MTTKKHGHAAGNAMFMSDTCPMQTCYKNAKNRAGYATCRVQ